MTDAYKFPDSPFKVGEQACSILDEMYSGDMDTWPPYLDSVDYLCYGIRGHAIEDQEVADRLNRQYANWLADRPI